MTSVKTTSAETRKLKTRTALHGALMELLAEKPFEEIQITDLTGRAQVGYATFFRHYASMHDVLNEIAGNEIRELFDMTIPVIQQYKTAVTLRALCQYVSDHHTLWRTLLTGGAAHTVRAEFIRQALEWAGKFEDGETPVPLELGTICTAGSTLDALAWWLERMDSYTVDEFAAFIDRLIITPFIGEK